MASRSSLLQLQRRLYSSNVSNKWSIRQVRKSDFHDCLGDLKNHISDSDFVAVSLQKTGSFSFPWHRVQPFDTRHIAYCKAKYAAEKFQILQFAVCPFSSRESKLIAYPYNFHLFPRDELNIGMPSYSFACQVSHLASMAREGFDFDACIYDGISYLSRAQESIAKVRMGCSTSSRQTNVYRQSIADSVFIQRVKSRVKQWRDACHSSTKTNDALLSSLRKLIIGSEQYGSRPSMTIDVCSERQVPLVLELLSEFSDDLVPLIIPAKGGGTQAIRAILTQSKEDKILLEKELQHLEEEENKRFRGFREVIDMVSASQKPIVSYNSLNDFTFIHSKFLASLPPTIDEFASSLHLVFPHVLDVNHLMSKIGALSKPTSIASALSYLKNHYFAPVGLDIPDEATRNECKFHGHNAIRVCHLFAKVCSVLKIDLNGFQSNDRHLAPMLEGCANVFDSSSTCHQESADEDIKVWTKKDRKVSCRHLVFLWGFRDGMTAGLLKTALQGSHNVFCEEFDIRFVDKKCAFVVFWQPGLSETFLDAINGDHILLGSLEDMVAEGLRAAGYETYKRVCRLGLWEADLVESLERALSKPHVTLEDDFKTNRSDVYYSSDSLINLNDL